MPEIEVEATEIVERKADGKGRVSIGRSRAGETYRVAVIEQVDGDENSEEQPAN